MFKWFKDLFGGVPAPEAPSLLHPNAYVNQLAAPGISQEQFADDYARHDADQARAQKLIKSIIRNNNDFFTRDYGSKTAFYSLPPGSTYEPALAADDEAWIAKRLDIEFVPEKARDPGH